MITTDALIARLTDAVDATTSHVERGGLPFVGQLVADDGFVSAYGMNRVRETGDPTAHAEIVAMRAVLRAGRPLEGLRLLATGEPCALCYRFAADHGVSGVHFAVGRDEAATWGFDYRASYASLGSLPLVRSATHVSVPRALAPFRAYAHLHSL